jgi:hypothetical protein
LFDLNATDLRVRDAPPPPRKRQPERGHRDPTAARAERAVHHLKKVGKKKGVPKE